MHERDKTRYVHTCGRIQIWHCKSQKIWHCPSRWSNCKSQWASRWSLITFSAQRKPTPDFMLFPHPQGPIHDAQIISFPFKCFNASMENWQVLKYVCNRISMENNTNLQTKKYENMQTSQVNGRFLFVQNMQISDGILIVRWEQKATLAASTLCSDWN
jgi:hypothetical protein